MDAIVLDRVSKSYGEKQVLKEFSLSVSAGSVCCIMGRSGCGKTTLLRLMMGLEAPDSGTITGVPEKKSAVFQEDRLCADFDAETNLRLVLRGRPDAAFLRRELEAVGIENQGKKPLREYSGGMARRVALARAMISDSEILFLDEPFKGLDDKTRETAIRYVQDRLNGRTLFIVTHSPEEASAFGGMLLRME